MANKHSITDLYAQFVRAHDAHRAVEACPEGGAEQKEFERLLKRCCGIAERLMKAPATSIDEMLLRLRVCAWDGAEMKYTRLEELDRWRPTTSDGAEYQVLFAIRCDLLRLQAAGLGGAGVWLRPEERNVDGTVRTPRQVVVD
jgi:hypothetical protein